MNKTINCIWIHENISMKVNTRKTLKIITGNSSLTASYSEGKKESKMNPHGCQY